MAHERARLPSGVAQALGPGIMYAGAAIGVSHLVQSTRAGAEYGLLLVWAVVAVHLFKYPFFEYGHRYAAATGESLLAGYRRMGRWSLVTYLVVAFGLSIPTAAVLTVLDGYPRVLTAGCRLAWPRADSLGRAPYWAFMLVMMAGAMLIFVFVTQIMKPLVDVTMTVAFLSAPLFAYLNFRVISRGGMPADGMPPPWLRALSWAGLIFLTCFSILFLVLHFGA